MTTGNMTCCRLQTKCRFKNKTKARSFFLRLWPNTCAASTLQKLISDNNCVCCGRHYPCSHMALTHHMHAHMCTAPEQKEKVPVLYWSLIMRQRLSKNNICPSSHHVFAWCRHLQFQEIQSLQDPDDLAWHGNSCNDLNGVHCACWILCIAPQNALCFHSIQYIQVGMLS